MSNEAQGILIIVAALTAGFIFGDITESQRSDRGHRQIGTAGHVCFANHTCRDQMRCVTGVNLEDGVCVK